MPASSRNVKKREDSCTCIADRAGTELSRFVRLVLTATFEGSATKIVAVTKGLMDSGVPEEKTKEMREAFRGAVQRSHEGVRAERNERRRSGGVRTLTTTCCIVGGGPAGMMLGLLLARAGVDVVVLEKHADFLRDFRGDTIHPSTLAGHAGARPARRAAAAAAQQGLQAPGPDRRYAGHHRRLHLPAAASATSSP